MADRAPAPPTFLADVMLERLARWLRAAGHDVASADPAAPDAAVRRRAAAEGRVLLTRDRRLADECAAGDARGGGPGACLRVRTARPLEQLAEVAAAFGLAPLALAFTRCLVCNAVLAPAEPGSPGAPATLPPGTALWRCPACGRTYWDGSHPRRMRQALVRAGLAAAGAAGHVLSPDPPAAPPAGTRRARPPAPTHPSTPEEQMSGSPGNTSSGTKGGRAPRDANHDVTARHGDDLAHGVRNSDATDAEASARGTRTGEQDSDRHDPDDPANRHENISET